MSVVGCLVDKRLFGRNQATQPIVKQAGPSIAVVVAVVIVMVLVVVVVVAVVIVVVLVVVIVVMVVVAIPPYSASFRAEC